MADLPLWRREAVGIPPWVGAKVHHSLLGDDRADVVTWFVDKPGFENWQVASYVTGFSLDTFGSTWADVPIVLDLADPDTRAAFLRRLAIRLGCPADLLPGGVLFFQDGAWAMVAGAPSYLPQRTETHGRHTVGFSPSVAFPWVRLLPGLGTDELCLALVRAWWSVEVEGA